MFLFNQNLIIKPKKNKIASGLIITFFEIKNVRFNYYVLQHNN